MVNSVDSVANMAKNTLEKLFVSIDILFSGMLVVFFQSGTFKAFGVLFDDLVIAYNTSNVYAGWIFTFQASIAFIVAGIAAPLLKGFQNRSVGITGGFLFGLGFVLNGLLGKTIYQLFVFTGISAVGGGLLYFSLIMTFLEHFDKETFPVAYSVKDPFQYLGITAIPVMLEQLREEYGLSGSYLIMGAIVWNCMISGVLMKPKTPCPKSVDHDHAHKSSELANRKDESAGPTDKTDETRMGNLLILCSIEPATRHPIFALYIMIHSLLSYSFVVWAVFLVPFGKSLGLPSDVAVRLSVFGGIGGLFGKLVVLFAFWSTRMNFITCSVIPSTILTVSLSGYIFFQDFWTLAVSSLFCGFSLAYAECALHGIVPRYLCKVHMRQGLAVSYFFSGALMQLGGIISGALLDISGSFTIIFSIVIFINIASIVLALGMHKMDGTIIECSE